MRHVELLLVESVDNLGIVGDVVKVRPGYARNFLLPRGLASKPTPGAIKRLAARRAEVEAELKARRADLEQIFEKVKNHEITIMRSANEQGVLFGGVSQHDIGEALRGEGFKIEDRMVRLGEQIKRLDTYHIPLVLASDLRTELKLWVVSDKPQEQLEGGEEAKKAEPEAPAAEEVKAEKPKKTRAAKAEKPAEAPAAEAAAPAAEGEKPKKPRGKKKAEEAAE